MGTQIYVYTSAYPFFLTKINIITVYMLCYVGKINALLLLNIYLTETSIFFWPKRLSFFAESSMLFLAETDPGRNVS